VLFILFSFLFLFSPIKAGPAMTALKESLGLVFVMYVKTRLQVNKTNKQFFLFFFFSNQVAQCELVESSSPSRSFNLFRNNNNNKSELKSKTSNNASNNEDDNSVVEEEVADQVCVTLFFLCFLGGE
jgi:hypothetical protein